jgi:hypothetical protein
MHILIRKHGSFNVFWVPESLTLVTHFVNITNVQFRTMKEIL